MKKRILCLLLVLLLTGCAAAPGPETEPSGILSETIPTSAPETVPTSLPQTPPATEPATVPASDPEPGPDPARARKDLDAVLKSKRLYIDRNGSAVYLNKGAIALGGGQYRPYAPMEYTYVDFDQDGLEELVVLVSYDFGLYLVLHHNGQDIFGYELGIRSLIPLKTDGSFKGSNGAASSCYCRMTFQDGGYTIHDEAVCDYLEEIYQINGKDVSPDAINEFVSSWNLKETVTWTPIAGTAPPVQTEPAPPPTEPPAPPTVATVPTEPTEPAPEQGVIYLRENEDPWETDRIQARIDHGSGFYSLTIPQKAAILRQTPNCLVFRLENEFSCAEYTLEIVPDIHSAPEAELKIKSITDALPNTLENTGHGVYVLQDLKEYFNKYNYDYYYGDDGPNIDDVWYDGVSSNGAAYFYESSTHTNWDDLVYDCMMSEAYSYMGGVAIHEKMEVLEFRYREYYATLQTRIEQNEVRSRMMECITVPFTSSAFDHVRYGFSHCLWDAVTLE